MDRELDDNLPVILDVIGIFGKLQIRYVLGGSYASSIHGKARFTEDADITAEPFPGKEAAWCSSFDKNYYVSLSAVTQAILRRSSFNVIHTPTGFKVDVFIQKNRRFEDTILDRAHAVSVISPAGPSINVMSPEDIILFKLEWFRLGGETSDRQWEDLLQVFKVQGARLDQTYLDHWANDLQVGDLLARVRQDAAAG